MTTTIPSPPPEATVKGGITPAHAEFYHDKGYLIVQECLNAAELETLKADAVKISRGEYGDIPYRFAALEDGTELQGIVANDLNDKTDDEVMERLLCIHFPHTASEVMRGFVSHANAVDALTGVIGPNVKAMQSMLFLKASGQPGQAWHQDEDYIPTRDRSLAGFWIALDDATVENGCLWVIPGSQKPGILWPQKETMDPRFDCGAESFDFPYSPKDEVPVEVKAGSAVMFNGYLLHRSLPNRSETGYRRAFVSHYMSAESLLPWGRPPEGVGVAKFDDRDIIMVAGVDPYGPSATTSRHKAALRAEGEGGCLKDPNFTVVETELNV